MPTSHPRHSITETPPVREALDALRLRGERVRMGDLVIRGARERLRELESERDEEAEQGRASPPAGGATAHGRGDRRGRGLRGPRARLDPSLSGYSQALLIDHSVWARATRWAPDRAPARDLRRVRSPPVNSGRARRRCWRCATAPAMASQFAVMARRTRRAGARSAHHRGRGVRGHRTGRACQRRPASHTASSRSIS